MPTTLGCPECGARLKLAQAPKPGTCLICPKCNEAIRVPDVDAIAVDDDPPPARPRGKPDRSKSGSNTQLIVLGLAVVGGVLVAGLGTLVYVLWPRSAPPPAFPPGIPAVASATNPGGRINPGTPRNINPSRPVNPDDDDPPERVPPPPDDGPPKPRGPWSLDWAGLNLADVDVGDLSARPAADLEALQYLPPRADAVFGLDVATLNAKLVFPWLMQKVVTLGEESPLDLLNRETGFRLSDVDHVVVAGRVDASPAGWTATKPFPVEATTYAIKTRSPFDRSAVLQNARAGPAKVHDGKEYHKLTVARKDKPVYLYLPTDQVIVVSLLPEAEFFGILKLDGKTPVLPPETLATLRALDRCHVWGVVPTDGLRANLPPGSSPLNLRATLESLPQARTLGVSVRFQGSQLHLGLAMGGGDKGLAAAFQEFWDNRGKAALGHGQGVPAGFRAAFAEIANKAKLQPRETVAAAVASVSLKSVDELLKAAE